MPQPSELPAGLAGQVAGSPNSKAVMVTMATVRVYGALLTLLCADPTSNPGGR